MNDFYSEVAFNAHVTDIECGTKTRVYIEIDLLRKSVWILILTIFRAALFLLFAYVEHPSRSHRPKDSY